MIDSLATPRRTRRCSLELGEDAEEGVQADPVLPLLHAGEIGLLNAEAGGARPASACAPCGARGSCAPRAGLRILLGGHDDMSFVAVLCQNGIAGWSEISILRPPRCQSPSVLRPATSPIIRRWGTLRHHLFLAQRAGPAGLPGALRRLGCSASSGPLCSRSGCCCSSRFVFSTVIEVAADRRARRPLLSLPVLRAAPWMALQEGVHAVGDGDHRQLQPGQEAALPGGDPGAWRWCWRPCCTRRSRRSSSSACWPLGELIWAACRCCCWRVPLQIALTLGLGLLLGASTSSSATPRRSSAWSSPAGST